MGSCIHWAVQPAPHTAADAEPGAGRGVMRHQQCATNALGAVPAGSACGACWRKERGCEGVHGPSSPAYLPAPPPSCR